MMLNIWLMMVDIWFMMANVLLNGFSYKWGYPNSWIGFLGNIHKWMIYGCFDGLNHLKKDLFCNRRFLSEIETIY